MAAQRRRNREILIADCGAPLQAIEMTTVSHDPETTAVRAHWVVVDAVPPNKSARRQFPANREKYREIIVLGRISEFLLPNRFAISMSYGRNSLNKITAE